MSNRRRIAYWIPTALASAAFAFGGVMDLAHGAEIEQGMAQLGYPAYVLTILGIWKVLGALAIAAPGLPRLKEWAYAGMVFDLTGAAFSHASVGDPAAKIATPLVLLGVVAASWALRPKDRTMAAPAAEIAEPVRLRAA